MSQCKAPDAAAQPLKISLPEKTFEFSIENLRNKIGSENITVDDYNLKKQKTYSAISLRKLLAEMATASSDLDEIVFRCVDGYAPSVSRALLDQGKLDSFYIAYSDNHSNGFDATVEQGKSQVSLGPFYIISTDPEAHRVLSWPYQVVEIKLIEFKKQFNRIYFSDLPRDSATLRGFHVFKENCLKCHSLNLQGGDLAPELNIPQNITEYRSIDFLNQFIRRPEQFRLKSKMPSFASLADNKISDVLAYLKYMRTRKMVFRE